MVQATADIEIVDDQIGNPTWAGSLAEATNRVLELAMKGGAADAGKASLYRFMDRISERAGLYHLAGDGFATRLQWASKSWRWTRSRMSRSCGSF